MPKVTAPLLSFDARGQIAKSQVYSAWRGIKYVRRHVVPSNPKTVAQTSVRDVFSMLNAFWLHATADARAPWNAYATGKPLLGRNALIKFDGAIFAKAPIPADLTGFIFSPGAGGGLPPTDLVVTPGVGTLEVAMSVPAAPTGWTLTASYVGAIPNVAPTDAFTGGMVVATAAALPWTCNLAGMTSAQEYVLGAWLKWTKPDNTLAYSASVATVGTPT